jgi:hypothetical protein
LNDLGDDQGLADQLCQQIEHFAWLDALATADLLGRFERPGRREHRQSAKQFAFRRREQVVAPVDRSFERALTGDGRSGAAGQQPKSIF